MVDNFVPKRKRIGLEFVFKFGKHKGYTVEYVLDEDPSYLLWCEEEIHWFTLEEDVHEKASIKDAEDNYYPHPYEDRVWEGSYSDDPGSPRY